MKSSSVIAMYSYQRLVIDADCVTTMVYWATVGSGSAYRDSSLLSIANNLKLISLFEN